ncbi:hypothetical protein AB0D84_17385 [Streptomyces sp. NPDC048193]|uniref:hypothetical protein n=1 Tax=unclassified Streptomyces TaxID=2593676 RepID=UPI00344729B2
MPWVRRVDQVRPTVLVRVGLRNLKQFIEALGKECGAWRGVVRNGHVRLLEPEPPRSRVPDWPVG